MLRELKLLLVKGIYEELRADIILSGESFLSKLRKQDKDTRRYSHWTRTFSPSNEARKNKCECIQIARRKKAIYGFNAIFIKISMAFF